MTIWKMISVSIKNCIKNYKTSLLYGVLIPVIYLSIVTADITSTIPVYAIAPRFSSKIFGILFTFLLPSVTILPLIITFTKPNLNGPFTFRDRLYSKFIPFSLITLLTSGILYLFISFVFLPISIIMSFIILPLTNNIFVWGLTEIIFIFIFALIIPLILQSFIFYSYITFTTENIGVMKSLKKGFKMFKNHLFRSIGYTFFITLLIVICPFAILFFYPIFTSFMVELYRKNWLEDNAIFNEETPEENTIYL